MGDQVRAPRLLGHETCNSVGLTLSEKETFGGTGSEVTYDLSYILEGTLAIMLRMEPVEGEDREILRRPKEGRSESRSISQ